MDKVDIDLLLTLQNPGFVRQFLGERLKGAKVAKNGPFLENNLTTAFRYSRKLLHLQCRIS